MRFGVVHAVIVDDFGVLLLTLGDFGDGSVDDIDHDAVGAGDK